MRLSFGNARCICRTTVRPPIPLSKMPMGSSDFFVAVSVMVSAGKLQSSGSWLNEFSLPHNARRNGLRHLFSPGHAVNFFRFGRIAHESALDQDRRHDGIAQDPKTRALHTAVLQPCAFCN